MQPQPAALVPREALSARRTVLPDTLVLGEVNLEKLNAYRAGVNQVCAVCRVPFARGSDAV